MSSTPIESKNATFGIRPEWIIPLISTPAHISTLPNQSETTNSAWLENKTVVVKDDIIFDLLNNSEFDKRFPDCPVIQLDGMALLPGLINAHCHAAMNLLRGYSDDLPLHQWLETAIWPVEAKFVDEQFVYDGTQLAIAEHIRSGTTCFQDMYFMPEQVAKAVQQGGIRANVGLMVVDSLTVWARNADECISKGIAVYDQFKHDSKLTFSFAPHAPYTVSELTLQKVSTLSFELSLNIQMHIHETAREVADFEKMHGMSPLAQMYKNGLLTPQLNAIHMTQLAPHEIDWLAETGTHVIHCPQSNMKLSSGICPVDKLINAGVNIAIGTDGAASNNDLDMFAEMQSAALLAKADSMNPESFSAYQALYAATMGGARALGLDHKIGSIEIGKQADLIAVDLNTIETQPVYNPISQIVYAASREHVKDVWVAGKQLLNNRKLTQMSESKLIHIAKSWKSKIQGLSND
ncbi:MAG: TRZ/ATZ family hydrolase [Kangiellaceae bacterium]|nr:TRZ/ATZ family hydrolase [Kangiellaceae bacterium]